MTRTHPWSELAAKIKADPVRRLRMDEYGLAMRDIEALAKYRSEMGLPEYEVGDEDDDFGLEASPDSAPADRYVAALRSYVELMGGRLEINAVFPDGTQTLLRDGRWVVAEAKDAERPDPAEGRAVAHAD
jgi:hypothetical protein